MSGRGGASAPVTSPARPRAGISHGPRRPQGAPPAEAEALEGPGGGQCFGLGHIYATAADKILHIRIGAPGGDALGQVVPMLRT